MKQVFKLKILNQLITAFIAAGSLGYINYWVLEKMDLTSHNNGGGNAYINSVTILCAIPDLIIYLFVRWIVRWFLILINKNDLNSIVPSCIALFFTALIIICITAHYGKKIVNGIYWIIGFLSTGNVKNGMTPGDPWTLIDVSGRSLVYLYKLNHEPIAYGYGECFSRDPNYSFNLQPAEKDSKQPSYDHVANCAYYDEIPIPIEDFKCKESHIHVNLQQKFIMVIFKIEKTKDK